jgi:hypothetical protein
MYNAYYDWINYKNIHRKKEGEGIRNIIIKSLLYGT